jgi:hypothetical protein
MKKIFVNKVGSSMIWFGAMPNTLETQVQNLKKMGFEIVKITD